MPGWQRVTTHRTEEITQRKWLPAIWGQWLWRNHVFRQNVNTRHLFIVSYTRSLFALNILGVCSMQIFPWDLEFRQLGFFWASRVRTECLSGSLTGWVSVPKSVSETIFLSVCLCIYMCVCLAVCLFLLLATIEIYVEFCRTVCPCIWFPWPTPRPVWSCDSTSLLKV